VVTALSVFLAT